MEELSVQSLSGTDIEEAGATRHQTRDSLLLAAQVRRRAGGATITARIRNLSAGGLMAEVGEGLYANDEVDIEVRGLGWVPGRVAWVTAGRVGIAFDRSIDPQAARKPVVRDEKPKLQKPIKPLL